MDRRDFIGGAVAACASFGLGTLTQATAAEAISREERELTINALKPPKRQRPLVAVVLDAAGSETTDALVPFGVLSRSGVADVAMISDRAGPVKLFPALTVRSSKTLALFDEEHPEGADYVVVPATHRRSSSPLLPWLAKQAEQGGTVVGICAGAKLLAAAGLLKSRRATTHWYDLNDLQRLAPTMTYVPDRRYVVDGNVATTTGVTASLPISLALVEAIAGRRTAGALASELGVSDWSASHRSESFRLSRGAFLTGLANRLSLRTGIAIPVREGVDEVALAFAADAWSRTYRSAAFAVSKQAEVRTSSGLPLLPDREDAAGLTAVGLHPEDKPAKALDRTLYAIEQRFGRSTADFVALQLEYQRYGLRAPA